MSFVFTDKELEKLMQLCRIACTDQEKQRLKENLTNILSYIDLLKEVNTEGIPPCNHVIETMHTVWREDTVGETLPRDIYLANTTHTGGMLRVPPVINS